jgi:hypothetical protein
VLQEVAGSGRLAESEDCGDVDEADGRLALAADAAIGRTLRGGLGAVDGGERVVVLPHCQ